MAEQPYAIEMRGITKTFGSVVANKDVNLTLKKGEILALLGENGSGKTTLMNMLSGIYAPDKGEILVDGKPAVIASPEDAKRLGIGMVHQHFKLVDVFSAADNIWMGKSGAGFSLGRDRYQEVADTAKRFGFDLDPRKKVESMAVSEKQTLEIIKVLYYGAKVIILDEPTAVLTVQEIEKLFGVLRRMKEDGHSIIIITHKLNEVLEVSDRVAILRKGEYIGTMDTASTNEQELTEYMVGRKVDLNIDRPVVEKTRPLLEIRDLTILNDEGATAIDHVNFYIRGGEILGVAGIAGCGQRELCEAIAGLQPIAGGAILCQHVSLEGLSPREIIRRGDMQVEFDGSRVDCFELVRTKEATEVEDHKIELIGPDIDEMPEGSKQSIAYIVDVAGKSMQSDFEAVFERKFHSYLNCVEGMMHTGQRDMIRIRVSKDTYQAGFRLKHIGEVLYARVKSEFAAVVDKCQVTIITDPAQCTELRHNLAIPMFDKRDERLTTLTDEGVDVYYSCIMCQAFSPSHVCVVTPERLGLCGAVSWLDAKATNELDPQGPCQVITKERVIDERIGEYEDVNEAVKKFSQGALEDVSLYSLIEKPMTSCGCFECICGIEPLSNGVCIANREYAGMTPIGMTFSELASMTGGGVQTPGFMGHGKHFIASKKFMKAEGGVARIVWMPKDLKEQVADRLNATAKELYGIDNFCDMIGDETIAEDPETLLEFLTEKGHPALGMEPMM